MQRLGICASHRISIQKIVAFLIIVIFNVTVEVKEGEKQQTVKTFKLRN